jgi:hypothetical protein
MIFGHLRGALGRAGLLFAAVVALALAPHGARSQPRKSVAFADGNHLLDLCNTDPEWCLGYVVAIADAMGTVQAGDGTVAGFRTCLPESVKQGQARDVAINFLRARPELRHLTASSLVAEALAEAFPCR